MIAVLNEAAIMTIEQQTKQIERNQQYLSAANELMDEINKMLGFEHSSEDSEAIKESLLVTLKTLTGNK